MTGAHLGERGARRPSTTQLQRDRRPPAGSAGVAAMVMVMDATTHGLSAAFFTQFLSVRNRVPQLPNWWTWTTPIGSKEASTLT